MRSKGIIGIIIIGVLALAFAGAIFVSGFIGSQKSFSITLKTSNILKELNQIESVKQFLDRALWYSYSQAIYNISQHSGYYGETNVPSYKGIYYWRVEHNTYFPSNYIDNIQRNVLDVLNKYANELKLSEYYTVDIYRDIGLVRARSPYGIKREIGDESFSFDVEDRQDVSINIDRNVFSIYDVAKSLYVDKNIIYESVRDKIKNICSSISKDQMCSDDSSGFATELHSRYCPDWYKNMISAIKSAVNNLNGVYENVYIVNELKDVRVWYTGSCTWSIGENKDEGIGLCVNETDSYNCQCSEDPCCENPTLILPCMSCGYSKIQPDSFSSPILCGCEENPYYCSDKVYSYSLCSNYVNIKCDYTNHAKVMVLVKVYYPIGDDISQEYPVYDGAKTEYKKIVLQFYVNTTIHS